MLLSADASLTSSPAVGPFAFFAGIFAAARANKTDGRKEMKRFSLNNLLTFFN